MKQRGSLCEDAVREVVFVEVKTGKSPRVS
jgi:predicted Holliday junction resolvase-like endonuclease